jgi:tRNA(fMet)-specific endonuclease VapC
LSYLLDTNVFISLMQGRTDAIRLRYRAVVEQRNAIYLSSIVHYELLYGVARSAKRNKNLRRLELAMGPEVSLLPFGAEDAAKAGLIRATLERTKQPIGPYDTLIAGQALARGLTLVTANTREFARVPGLVWQDWADS